MKIDKYLWEKRKSSSFGAHVAETLFPVFFTWTNPIRAIRGERREVRKGESPARNAWNTIEGRFSVSCAALACALAGLHSRPNVVVLVSFQMEKQPG